MIFQMKKIAEKLSQKTISKYSTICDIRSPEFNITLCNEVLDSEFENIIQAPKLKLDL